MPLNGRMTDQKTSNSLKQRLLENQERHSLLGDKPQGLSLEEIQLRVQKFMIRIEKLKMPFSFGEGIGVGNTSETDAQFDPVKEYKDDPDRLDDITMYVEHDMEYRQNELLKEAGSFECSYNTLLFGAALKLENKEDMSDELRKFVYRHLVSPPEKPKKRGGRPKITTLDEKLRCQAIEFACKHGLTATRNDVSDPHSACDVVAAAALALCQSGKKQYKKGYGYDNLKKIWNEYSRT